MAFSPLVDELVESLRCLPGVGQKTAQRMAFHLLERATTPGDALKRCVWSKVRQTFWPLSRPVTTGGAISC